MATQDATRREIERPAQRERPQAANRIGRTSRLKPASRPRPQQSVLQRGERLSIDLHHEYEYRGQQPNPPLSPFALHLACRSSAKIGIQSLAIVPQHASLHLDPRSAQHRNRISTMGGSGIERSNDHSTNPCLDQSPRARPRPPFSGARLKRHVDRRPFLGSATQTLQGDSLRVRPAIASEETPSHDTTPLHNDRPHPRIGSRQAHLALSRFDKRLSHEILVLFRHAHSNPKIASNESHVTTRVPQPPHAHPHLILQRWKVNCRARQARAAILAPSALPRSSGKAPRRPLFAPGRCSDRFGDSETSAASRPPPLESPAPERSRPPASRRYTSRTAA